MDSAAKEKQREISKKHYQENKDEILKRTGEYRKNHKENYKAYQKKFLDTHPGYYKEYGKKYREEHKDYVSEQLRNRMLIRNYGLTPDEYDALLESQGGACAICGKRETAKHQCGKVRWLSVDHDHKTGAVRGLLCSRCNLAIGLLLDDSESVSRVIDYLVKNNLTTVK